MSTPPTLARPLTCCHCCYSIARKSLSVSSSWDCLCCWFVFCLIRGRFSSIFNFFRCLLSVLVTTDPQRWVVDRKDILGNFDLYSSTCFSMWISNVEYELLNKVYVGGTRLLSPGLFGEYVLVLVFEAFGNAVCRRWEGLACSVSSWVLSVLFRRCLPAFLPIGSPKALRSIVVYVF